MEKILLRRAASSDTEAVLAITKLSFEQYAKEVRHRENIQALHETLEDVRRDIETKYVYICEMDGQLVGSVRFEILSEQIAYLSRFAMHPDIQNLGLGGLLLEKVRLECVNLGVRAITLHTASRMRSSVAFYLKNGYYIHSITKSAEYIRALMVNELIDMDELFDYESITGSK